jgi:hypothetical protein
MQMTVKTTSFLRDLGDNLVLRRSTAADADKLGAFNARIHGEDEQDAARVSEWTKDLLRSNHPTFGEGDYTIVENAQTGEIVSSLNLINQTWSFGGIQFSVGRPELVGTDPTYRNRGLVRIQMDTIHEWSRERGHMLLGITGIPYYYRLFGYEMALNLSGGRTGYVAHVPRLKEGQAEPFNIRPATEEDLPFIATLYDTAQRRSLVACIRTTDQWRYELNGMNAQNVNRIELRIIETSDHKAVGFIGHPFFLWNGNYLPATLYELIPPASFYEITPSVIRYLWETGKAYAQGANKELEAFGFRLGSEHPAYQAASERLPRLRKPYAWYLRVPDLQAFVKLITPVLESRLSNSIATGYTGELKFSFYRSGIKFGFESGRLNVLEAWQPTPKEWGSAAFPGLTFLQLLFGYRSLEELQFAFADCWAKEDLLPVINILFPKQFSDVFPVS